MTDRFDINELDPEDPFEVDEGNRVHLHKHVANDAGGDIVIGPQDVLDVFMYGEPIFYPANPAKGDAEWLMIGEVPGVVLVVPLARTRSGNPKMSSDEHPSSKRDRTSKVSRGCP